MYKLLSATLGAGFLLAFLASNAGAADAVAPGQDIFIKNKCSQCHTITALKITKEEGAEEEEAVEGEEKVDPPDLSDVGKNRTAEWITKWEKKEEKNKGRKHKKKWKGTDEDLKTLADWLATLKYDVAKK